MRPWRESARANEKNVEPVYEGERCVLNARDLPDFCSIGLNAMVLEQTQHGVEDPQALLATMLEFVVAGDDHRNPTAMWH